MTRILVINGSYREKGVTDRTLAVMIDAVETAGATVESVVLRDRPIGFCLNCRECTQHPGEAPGFCVQVDGMGELVAAIERADGFILASPTNFGSVTALFKRFMERLVVYAYWPWGAPAPRLRKRGQRPKQAVLVSSCAAPGLLGRLVYGTRGQLKTAAETIGARVVATCFAGFVSSTPQPELPQRTKRRAQAAARRLVSRCRAA